jgi:hypothetical protein
VGTKFRTGVRCATVSVGLGVVANLIYATLAPHPPPLLLRVLFSYEISVSPIPVIVFFALLVTGQDAFRRGSVLYARRQRKTVPLARVRNHRPNASSAPATSSLLPDAWKHFSDAYLAPAVEEIGRSEQEVDPTRIEVSALQAAIKQAALPEMVPSTLRTALTKLETEALAAISHAKRYPRDVLVRDALRDSYLRAATAAKNQVARYEWMRAEIRAIPYASGQVLNCILCGFKEQFPELMWDHMVRHYNEARHRPRS